MFILFKSSDFTKPIGNQQGITLVEIMVYMVIAGMLMATAVLAFTAQNKSYNRQDVIAEIQQNIRGTTEIMVSDVRFAGLGMTDGSAVAFALADPSELGVSYWADPDDYWSHVDDYWGNTLDDENITVFYRLTNSNLERGLTEEGNDIGDVPHWNILAERIEKLRFEYLVDNDPDETEGDWQWYGNITETDDELEKIRAVKIIMIGGGREAAFNPTDPTTYILPLDETPPNPPEGPWVPVAGTGYKRMMSVIAQARNNRD